MPKTIRVRIAYTVEVDVSAWQQEYGIAPDDVREDVKRYFTPIVTSDLPHGAASDGIAWIPD